MASSGCSSSGNIPNYGDTANRGQTQQPNMEMICGLSEEQGKFLTKVVVLISDIVINIPHGYILTRTWDELARTVLERGSYNDKEREKLKILREWYMSNKNASRRGTYDKSYNLY